MTTLKTVPEVLREAVNVLRKRGHCKGVYENSTGRVCAVGALRVALFGTVFLSSGQLYYETYEALNNYVETRGWEGIPHFNDEPDRTAEEVIAALEGAANR